MLPWPSAWLDFQAGCGLRTSLAILKRSQHHARESRVRRRIGIRQYGLIRPARQLPWELVSSSTIFRTSMI